MFNGLNRYVFAGLAMAAADWTVAFGLDRLGLLSDLIGGGFSQIDQEMHFGAAAFDFIVGVVSNFLFFGVLWLILTSLFMVLKRPIYGWGNVIGGLMLAVVSAIALLKLFGLLTMFEWIAPTQVGLAAVGGLAWGIVMMATEGPRQRVKQYD